MQGQGPMTTMLKSDTGKAAVQVHPIVAGYLPISGLTLGGAFCKYSEGAVDISRFHHYKSGGINQMVIRYCTVHRATRT